MSRYRSEQIAVGTVAVPIGTAAPDIVHSITAINYTNAEVYIGDANVSTASGFHLSKGLPPIVFRISDGDILWAIANAADSEVHVYDFQENI
jgi:hypothetical protein